MTKTIDLDKASLTLEERASFRTRFPAEVNILIGEHCLPSDRELFFGPLHESDIFIQSKGHTFFPILLKELGCFKSSSDAKKNGWNKEIPEGWSTITVGKAPKLHIYILKLTKPIFSSATHELMELPLSIQYFD